MAEKIRLTKTGITAPMYCELAAVDYWVNERGWVIDPSDQTPPPPGSQPVTHDELDAFGLTDLADVTTTGAAVGQLLAVADDSPLSFELKKIELPVIPTTAGRVIADSDVPVRSGASTAAVILHPTERARQVLIAVNLGSETMKVAEGSLDSTSTPGSGFVDVPAGSEYVTSSVLPIFAYFPTTAGTARVYCEQEG